MELTPSQRQLLVEGRRQLLAARARIDARRGALLATVHRPLLERADSGIFSCPDITAVRHCQHFVDCISRSLPEACYPWYRPPDRSE